MVLGAAAEAAHRNPAKGGEVGWIQGRNRTCGSPIDGFGGRFGSGSADWGRAAAQVLGGRGGGRGGCRASESELDRYDSTAWGGPGEGEKGVHCDGELCRWPEGANPLPNSNGGRRRPRA